MSIARVIFQKTKTAMTKKIVKEKQTSEASNLAQEVILVLRDIYDPELPVNVYDLGLIYNIDIDGHSEVFIRMTLTAPGCPMAASIVNEVKHRLKALDGVTDAHVELVWDPPWDQDSMSDEAKLTLGLF